MRRVLNRKGFIAFVASLVVIFIIPSKGFTGMTADVRFACHDAPDALCAAFLDVLKTRYPNTSFSADDAEAKSFLDFAVLRKGEVFLITQLSWAGQIGSGTGPEVEFSVMDAPLIPAMYPELAKGVLLATNPPLS